MAPSTDTPDPSGAAAEDPAENKLLDKLRETMPGPGGSKPPSPATPAQEPDQPGRKP